MKAEVISKSLVILCDNDIERKKIYDFISALTTSTLGIMDVGTLEIDGETEKIGLYLEVLDVKSENSGG